MNPRILIVLLTAGLVLSCTDRLSEVYTMAQESRSFVVEVESARTSVDGLHITWEEGDPIAVFDKTAVGRFVVSGSGGAFSASGSVTAGATQFAGTYPWRDAAKRMSGAITSSPLIPSEQSNADGSNVPLAALFSSSGSLLFTPVAAVFKFVVDEEDGGRYARVTISGNNAEKGLCGTCLFNHSTGNVTIQNPGSSIAFAPESGAIPAGTYYLPFYVSGAATASRSFSAGITIMAETAAGAVFYKKSTAALSCKRGVIYNCGSLPATEARVIPGDPDAEEYATEPMKFKGEASGSYTTYQTRTALGMQRMDRICEGNSNQDRWGGWNGVKPDSYISTNTEGFWRTGRWKGRSVMVDPDGNVAVLRGMNYVCPEPMCRASTSTSKEVYETRFPSDLEWSVYAGNLLDSLGFNMFMVGPSIIGNYRHDSSSGHGMSEEMENNLRHPASGRELSQIEWLNFLIQFNWGYKNYGVGSPTTSAPWMAMMFDPEYIPHIEGLARDGAELFKDCKNFIGYYTDNELGMYESTTSSNKLLTLKNFLALKGVTSPRYCSCAYDWAVEWMKENYGTDVYSSEMEDPFIEAVVGYYYRTASEAIHKYDPNHLYLGSRLHYNSKKKATVLRACAKYCDVISLNYYENVFEPVASYFGVDLPASVGEKPYLVTEFYVKNITSPYVNEGAGDFTDCQRSRGLWYNNFTIKLIEEGNCAGWQWFKYNDDYRTASSGWVNKGIIKSDMSGPYKECTDLMEELNRNTYQILDYYTPVK